jgi:hypothetical protein
MEMELVKSELEGTKIELAKVKIDVSKLNLELRLLANEDGPSDTIPYPSLKSKIENQIPKRTLKLLTQFKIEDKDFRIRTFSFQFFGHSVLSYHKPAKSAHHLISKFLIENPLKITSRKMHSNVIRDVRSSPHNPNQILTVSQDKTMFFIE